MGFYEAHILPRIINAVFGVGAMQPLRRRACAGLEGEVVEIGFGSGHNVLFYPSTVSCVAAVEPADLAWQLADGRVKGSPRPCRRPDPGSVWSYPPAGTFS